MLLRQTLLYLPAQLLGPLFQFVAVIAWTHFLSPSELGLFALIAAAQELAYAGVLFWFSLYTLRYYDPAGGADDRRRYLDTESAVLIVSSVMTALLLLVIPLVVDGPWSAELLFATIAYSVTRSAVSQYSDRARAEHDSFSYSVLQICWPVLGLFLGIALVKIHGPNTASVLLGYAIAQTISLVVAFWRLGASRTPQRVSMEMVRGALAYGLPLVVGAILIWVANNGIRFVVEHEQGAAAVGLLTVGWGLGLRATSFASMLTTAAAFPVAMKRAREEGIDAGQSQLERNGILLLVALVPAAVGLWAIAEPLVELVVAEEYREMTISILPMAVLAGAVRSFRIHFGEQIFLLREQPMIPVVNDAIDAVASMAASYAGLMMAGLPGAVAGGAAAAIFSLIVTALWGWSRYRFGLALGGVVRIAIASGVMLGVVHLLPISATPLGIALDVVGGAAVYTAMLAMLHPEAFAKAADIVRSRMA